MTKQTSWLDENSPYRIHKSNRREFCKENCCGQIPQPDGSEILHHHPEKDAFCWFSLYQCAVCGRYYIALNNKWKEIHSLIRYERRAKDCNFEDDMVR